MTAIPSNEYSDGLQSVDDDILIVDPENRTVI